LEEKALLFPGGHENISLKEKYIYGPGGKQDTIFLLRKRGARTGARLWETMAQEKDYYLHLLEKAREKGMEVYS